MHNRFIITSSLYVIADKDTKQMFFIKGEVMQNSTLFKVTILLLSGIFSQTGDAGEINITINGQGTVLAEEAGSSCSANCILNNDLDKNTLIATANTNSKFVGWSGQKCDAGNEVFIDTSINAIDNVKGGAKTLASADINGDELDDLASISLFDGVIQRLISNGDGTFSIKMIAQDLKYPSALDFYDWDGDSDQDLLVAEYGRRALKLYRNDGLGEFNFVKDIAISNVRPYAFKVADINKDDIPDLLISSFEANTSGDLFTLVDSISNANISWYLNNGNDEFSHELDVSNTAAVTLDINHDDAFKTFNIVSAEIVNGEIALYQQVDKNIQRSVIDSGRGSYGAAFGDIDDDGLVDILATHYQPSKINLLYNKGNNTFSSAFTITRPMEGVTAAVFGDFNDDSYLDIGSGEFNANIFYFFANKGYRDCVVLNNANIQLTANFEQNADDTIVESTNDSSSGSSGGSVSFGLLALFIAGLRKKHHL